MKIKGISKLLLITMGTFLFVLTGCGSNKDTTEAKTDVVPTEVIEETETKPEDVETGLKDIEESVDGEITQTQPEDIRGEGTTDRVVPDLGGVEESAIGEPVMFANEAGADLCLFAIESVSSSDMAIENMGDVTDKKVVIVGYSYTNMSAEEKILFDDMSFKLLANDAVCTPYFSPELTPAAPSGIGETAFGQVAFLVDNACEEVILVFDNVSVDAKAMFKAPIE